MQIQKKIKRNQKKSNIKNYKKEIIERKDYIYNNISIENIKFSSSKEENYLSFYFDLNIPYSQKNILLKNILNIVLKIKNLKSVKNINVIY